MSKNKATNLFDATYMMFNDFNRQIEEAIKTYLPNIVPDVFNLIDYCKGKNISRENRIDLGYTDLYAWYENIKDFDCLLMQDQNYDFLVLAKKEGEIYVYEIENMHRIEKMSPSLEDFESIVIPNLKESDKKWNEFFEAINHGNLDEVSSGIVENCSIEPIITLKYCEYEMGNEKTIHKHALVKAGFNFISDIKKLNSLENQIGQFMVSIQK